MQGWGKLVDRGCAEALLRTTGVGRISGLARPARRRRPHRRSIRRGHAQGNCTAPAVAAACCLAEAAPPGTVSAVCREWMALPDRRRALAARAKRQASAPHLEWLRVPLPDFFRWAASVRSSSRSASLRPRRYRAPQRLGSWQRNFCSAGVRQSRRRWPRSGAEFVERCPARPASASVVAVPRFQVSPLPAGRTKGASNLALGTRRSALSLAKADRRCSLWRGCCVASRGLVKPDRRRRRWPRPCARP